MYASYHPIAGTEIYRADELYEMGSFAFVTELVRTADGVDMIELEDGVGYRLAGCAVCLDPEDGAEQHLFVCNKDVDLSEANDLVSEFMSELLS